MIDKDQVLPYPDLHVEKIGPKIETGVYQNPIDSGSKNRQAEPSFISDALLHVIIMSNEYTQKQQQ